MEKTFNPNDVSVANGNYFALPYTIEQSKLVLLSVPWDVTTSYRPGSAKAPDAIIDASGQVDLYDLDFGSIYQEGIATIPINEDILEKSTALRKSAELVIKYLEDGGNLNDIFIQRALKKVNEASESVNDYVYKTAKEHLDTGKIVGLVGGDHSTPFGLIKAISEKYDSFGLLHIDAHADLRVAYEGFEYSHASIMYNVTTKIDHLDSLVQVAIRDFCEDEFDRINNNSKITTFFDRDLSSMALNGVSWASQAEEIVSKLPQNVYISFDIDGLKQSYCPNTGTPVPGGIDYDQAIYLLCLVAKSGRRIIGFDINEVGYSESTDWDANVGARLLFKMSCLALESNKSVEK